MTRSRIWTGLVVVCSLATAVFFSSSLRAQTRVIEFVEPELRQSRNGLLDTTFVVRYAENVLDNVAVYTRTYEGTVGGPTLKVKPGDTLRLAIDNRLPKNKTMVIDRGHNFPHDLNSTNIHTHGLHVSPLGNSDNTFIKINPGEKFQYEFKIPANHHGGTFLYHPHYHGSVIPQIWGGMAGAIIIEGPLDRVPEIAAAKDVTFMMTNVRTTLAGEVPDPNEEGEEAETIFAAPLSFIAVNGRIAPTLKMRPGEVQRLRVINGSSGVLFDFQIAGHTLYEIAHDGITLPAIKASGSVFMGSGDRVDILVKAGAPGRYPILKPPYHTGRDRDRSIDLAYLEVSGPAVDMPLPRSLPQDDVPHDIAASEIKGKRTIRFDACRHDVGHLSPECVAAEADHENHGVPSPLFLMNGKLFNPSRTDYSLPLGSAEEWTITNYDHHDHPIHYHVNPFQVVAVNGDRLDTPVWEDTVNVPKNSSITIRTRYEDFVGAFVIHCHIIDHEEFGMMQKAEVVPSR